MEEKIDFFYMDIEKLIPSQMYLNINKIKALEEQINPFVIENIPPISIRKFGQELVFLDGHSRAYLAYKHGLKQVPVYWEPEEYNWEAYEQCIQWCKNAGIYHVSDLKDRFLDDKDYQELWIDRCQQIFN